MKSSPAQSGVLVAHPSRQHSHRLAAALQSSGQLAVYITGHFASPLRALPVAHAEIPALKQELSAGKLLAWPAFSVIRGIATRILSQPASHWIEHILYRLFDRRVAKRSFRGKYEAVVGYEMACLETFKVAKAQGVVTILDAASVYYRVQDAALGYDQEKLSLDEKRVRRIKDEEIELADFIITASEFARDSYVKVGVPADRIMAVQMGVDLARFELVRRKPNDLFTFGFVGRAVPHKGIFELAEAFRRINAAGLRCRLVFVGEAASEYRRQFDAAQVEFCGVLPHSQLVGRMAEIDCLVLPSRFDSFGMVVIEALATGMPAIVSDQVGAREAIVPGETGWIVPSADVDALAERMRWAAEHAQALEGMASSCRSMAEQFSWDAYSKRIVNLFKQILPAS